MTFTPPKDDLRGVNTRYGIDGFSSSGGPLKVSYPNTPEDLAEWVERGLNYIGLKNATGFNEGVLDGVSYAATTIDPNGGFRSSSRQSFLRSAEKRTNLVVLTATLAKQIIFTDAKRAIGVTVGPTLLGIGGGLSLQTLYANKEVIVSAGAFQSPQLLMTSGVGPSDQLAKFNIPIVSNLSGVGQVECVIISINYILKFIYDRQWRTTSSSLPPILLNRNLCRLIPMRSILSPAWRMIQCIWPNSSRYSQPTKQAHLPTTVVTTSAGRS